MSNFHYTKQYNFIKAIPVTGREGPQGCETSQKHFLWTLPLFLYRKMYILVIETYTGGTLSPEDGY
jgi:hypothetical protein